MPTQAAKPIRLRRWLRGLLVVGYVAIVVLGLTTEVQPRIFWTMLLPLLPISIVVTFGVGAAMAGAAGVLYGMVWVICNFFVGFFPGINAFTAAVLASVSAASRARRRPSSGSSARAAPERPAKALAWALVLLTVRRSYRLGA